ncbi:MAG: MerC domain-containing protein [Acidobacteriota bacterium]|nr:MerC domain-containing protein [Acidobacteriota bacterium]
MITKSEYRFDQLGMAASTVCAIHCILMALTPIALVLGGLEFLSGREAEWGISLSAIFSAMLAAAIGFRAHGSIRVAAVLFVGATMLMIARFLEERGVHGPGTVLGVFAGIGLVSGHLLNLQAGRCCGDGS